MASVCRSRLCLPFLRPLLPLAAQNKEAIRPKDLSSSAILVENERTNGGVDCSKSQASMSDSNLVDVLNIFEKIRRLEYQSSDQLLCDLNKLRLLIAEKVGLQSSDSQQVLWAFDSLIEAATRYDTAHQVLHSKLGKAIVNEHYNTCAKDFTFDEINTASAQTQNTDTDIVTTNRGNALHNSHFSDIQLNQCDIHNAKLELQKLWRRECESLIKSACMSRNYFVPQKLSVLDWCDYLAKGSMPVSSQRAPVDSAGEPCATESLASESYPFFGEGKLSWIRALGIEELVNVIYFHLLQHLFSFLCFRHLK